MISLPAKRFFMIRHGEAVANAEGRVAGSIDSPLTDKGRKEPLAVRKYLGTLADQPKLIIHTPLLRSKETSIILNETMNIPMLECASMTERCFGDWQGLPLETMRALRDAGQDPPNGEPMGAFQQRVLNGLSEILELQEEPVLIVTHGGVFGALMGAYNCKIDVVKNCHLYEFVPVADAASFPWQIFSHDLNEESAASRNLIEITKISGIAAGHNIIRSSRQNQRLVLKV